MFNGRAWLLILCWLVTAPWARAQVQEQEELRDPTRPLEFRAQSPSRPMSLNSILIGDGRRLAIINGQQLTEGAYVPGTGRVRVIRIQSQSVLLERGNKRWRLSIPAAAESIRTGSNEDN